MGPPSACIGANNDKPASFHHENWRVLSEWRDSNSRHPGPKEPVELFSNIFCFFLLLFVPEMLISRTLVSTSSMCSKPSYGQICGQKPLPKILGDNLTNQEAVFFVPL